MDTLGFLKAILPEEGVHYLGIMSAGQSGVGHKAYTSLEDMAAALLRLDKHPDLTVFHACAAYLREYVEVTKDGDTRKKYRVEINWLAAKAFWVDLDVGAEKAESGKGYATQDAAWYAIASFCKTQGLPLPLVVNSGYGVHCYWPLTEEVAPADWKRVAEKFKAVLSHAMVHADPTRTADFASILRPPGSHNKKDPKHPKVVKVVREAGPTRFEDFEASLDRSIEANFITVDLGRAPAGFEANDDLTAHLPQYDDTPRDAEEIANGCQQVAIMRDTQGDVNYETWRGVIGVLTFCEDGFKIAHEWSARRADTGHGQVDVSHKFNTWNAGPTKCDFFARANKEACEGCAYKGKITSPVQLGRVEQAPAPAAVEEVVVEGENTVVSVETPEELRGFRWNGTNMVRDVRGKLGVLEAIPFTYTRFYLTQRISTIDGRSMVRCRMHLPKNVLREFDIPCGLISSTSATELSKLIGHYELMPTPNKDAMTHLTAYLKDSLNRLMHTADQMRTMGTFGWREDGSFLIGDRLYQPDGGVVKVILGGTAMSALNAFPTPKGTTEGWAEGIDFLYNRHGMEPMQYALCSGFGSLLSVFGEDLYKGIPLALTSTETALGKTTVAMAAMYAFGDASEMMFNGQKKGMSVISRPLLMSTYNNIPLLVDEITNIAGDDLSDLLYAAANGKDRTRGKMKDGEVVLAKTQTWRMSMYLTANTSISTTLSAKQLNTKAEAVRAFEIKLGQYHIPKLDVADVERAAAKWGRNMGKAGEAFVMWCVTRRKELEQRFERIGMDLRKEQSVLDNNEYRLFRQHAICTLLAAEILRGMGLIQFDLERLRLWTTDHIAQMVEDINNDNEVTTTDSLSRMVSSLSSRIIVTTGFATGTNAFLEPPLNRIDKDPVGRWVTGKSNTAEPQPHAGKLYLTQEAVRTWCGQNRVDRTAMIHEAMAKGIVAGVARMTLGQGTTIATGRSMCYVINIDKLQGTGAHAAMQAEELGEGD